MKEPKEFDYFKAWLLFFLFATVGGTMLGLIIGSFIAAFMGAGGSSLAQVARINQIVGIVLAIPMSYFAFRAVVGKYLFPKIEDDSQPEKE